MATNEQQEIGVFVRRHTAVSAARRRVSAAVVAEVQGEHYGEPEDREREHSGKRSHCFGPRRPSQRDASAIGL
ncbi:MAG: hypothetical protein IPF51_10595 [Dehalococcoidia bacterium]|uniref:hypothetical protein n=1 Tax=Candidatus Amarobacter glycogenicus TaxID=3140699 RepID=UPI0031355658|nr:hypothetical protein [Dehalococcoidia bacterium]